MRCYSGLLRLVIKRIFFIREQMDEATYVVSFVLPVATCPTLRALAKCPPTTLSTSILYNPMGATSAPTTLYNYAYASHARTSSPFCLDTVERRSSLQALFTNTPN